MRRHFLKASFNPGWTEVTKEEWLRAERNAGFRSKSRSEYATGGFGSNGISGTYTDDGSVPCYLP